MTDSKPTITVPEPSLPPPPHPTPTAKGNIVTAILKDPQEVARTIAGQVSLLRSGIALLAAGVLCHAVFGLAVGLFGGLPVATMDIVKAPLIAVCSLLLCFPSLYVFACVGGSPLSLSQTFVLGCACLAMVGLLLAGLAPVAWLFAASTQNMPFVVLLTLFIWLIAISFAARFVGKLKASALFQRQAGIGVWFLILVLVTLQMTTCMRPILTKPEKSWWTGEKKFFLAHFGASFEQPKETKK